MDLIFSPNWTIEPLITSPGQPGAGALRDQPDIEKLILTVYTITALVIGIIGNTAVIIATLKYETFKLDKMTLIFVCNLAVADLFYITTSVLPRAVYMVVGKWVLGKYYCFYNQMFYVLPVVAKMQFVLAIAVHRYVRCCHPILADKITARQATIFCIFVWIYSTPSTITSIVYYLLSDLEKPLRYINFCVNYTTKKQSESAMFYIRFSVQIVLPFISIIFFNMRLLKFSLSEAAKLGKHNLRAIRTIGLISVVFILTWIPNHVVVCLMLLGQNIKGNHLARIRISFFFVGSFCNPIIYTVVNKSFKDFILDKFVVTAKRLYLGCKNAKNDIFLG